MEKFDIVNKSEPLSTVLYLYTMSEEIPSTVRYSIKLNEQVDGEILRKAVATTFIRYPYLKKSLVEDSKGRYLIDNPRPIAVLETDRKITLNAEETNYQLIAISYSGQMLFFNNSHAILDGRGRVPVMKTLLYYYCKERYNEDVAIDGLNLYDSPIDPKEYAEPLNTEISVDTDNLINSGKINGEPMELASMGLVHSEGRMKKSILKIDEKEFMGICRKSDASPNVAISLLLCRAIRSVHPDSPKIPVASIAVDLKNSYGTPDTCYPAAWLTSMAYDKAMENLPFGEQCTIFRGKLILDTDKSNMDLLARDYRLFIQAVASQKDLKSKLEFMNTALSKAAPRTFSVSYSGKSSYGSCDKHIRGMAAEVFVLSPMTVELTVGGGNFFATYSQMFEEDVYFDAFLKELSSFGISYRIVSQSYIEGPGMNIINIDESDMNR